MDLLVSFQSSLPDALASAALLSALMIAGWIMRRTLKLRADFQPQVARRWNANIRNALLLVAAIGLLMIWAPQLRTFALSLTAVAVAIVVATKELLLCLSGAAFRTFTRAFAIGDIIEIGSNRGEVIDISLLATRLRETDHRGGPGRTQAQSTVIPHSLLFTQPVRILARADTLSEHIFALVFETRLDLFSRLDAIRSIAVSACEQASTEDQLVDPAPFEDLRVSVTTTELGRLKLEFSLMARPENAATLERSVTSAVGSFVLSIKTDGCAT